MTVLLLGAWRFDITTTIAELFVRPELLRD